MIYIIFSIVAVILCIALASFIVGIFGYKKKLSTGKGIILTLVLAAILFALVVLIYLGKYHHAYGIDGYLHSNDKVTVSKIEDGYYFDGPGSEDALVFYPGAKVEYTAYAPVMEKLAEKGTDVFLLKMPFNMAFLGVNKAKGLFEPFPHENWYLSGHSLGGVAAAMFAEDNPEVKGVILLASYPTKQLQCRMLTIYGNKDGCLNMKKYEESRSIWPSDTTEIVMDGFNHAQFGSYGEQSGDNKAEVTAEYQQETTAQMIQEWIEGGK